MNPALKIAVGVASGIIILAVGWWAWHALGEPRENVACNPEKISFELDALEPNGPVSAPGISIPVDYEFCIPDSDRTLQEVNQIDPAITCQNGPSGRIGCTEDEYLCIGNTAGKDAVSVLCKLSLLGYIERIDQAFWE